MVLGVAFQMLYFEPVCKGHSCLSLWSFWHLVYPDKLKFSTYTLSTDILSTRAQKFRLPEHRNFVYNWKIVYSKLCTEISPTSELTFCYQNYWNFVYQNKILHSWYTDTTRARMSLRLFLFLLILKLDCLAEQT